jgi:hypothetical protein
MRIRTNADGTSAAPPRRGRKLGPLTAFACVLAAVGYSLTAESADHQDSPATTADPTADINDVYAFMSGTNNVIFAMTVFPNAPQGAQFSNTVQYVLHTMSGMAFGMATSSVDIIATFDVSQVVSLWVGQSEFVTGNGSQAGGLTSADGLVTVFTGLRADPFFFNLDGFKATVTDVIAAEPLPTNDAGCPTLSAATSAILAKQLDSAPDGGPPGNHFATFNTLAIVVQVDKSLVTQGGPLVSVWGATYSKAPASDAGADGGAGPADASGEGG